MTAELLTKMSFSPISEGEEDVSQFLSEIRKFPRLTPEEEKALAKRCSESDEDAIRQMVNCNLRLVVSVAREYSGRGVPLLDLVQEGCIGLLAAAKRFDYTMDFRFSTYATKWIRQGITKCLASHGMIRVPAHTAERIRKVHTARAQFIQKNAIEPTMEELAELCQMTVQRVQQLLQLHPEVCSLDAPVGDEDATLGVYLEDILSPQPYEELVREELNLSMNRLLSALNERQQLTLRLHFGMEDGVCHSLEEISKILGVSKERVRQIERQAMDKLQQLGAGMGLEDFLS